MTDTGGFFKPDSDEDKEAFTKRVLEALRVSPSTQQTGITEEAEREREEGPER